MALFKTSDPADALIDFLDRESTAILSGRFDVLERLSVEKERLLQDISRSALSPETLLQLRQRAERNGNLLAAMRTGVAAAQARIKSIRRGTGMLTTYDADGRTTALPRSGSLSTRRA